MKLTQLMIVVPLFMSAGVNAGAKERFLLDRTNTWWHVESVEKDVGQFITGDKSYPLKHLNIKRTVMEWFWQQSAQAKNAYQLYDDHFLLAINRPENDAKIINVVNHYDWRGPAVVLATLAIAVKYRHELKAGAQRLGNWGLQKLGRGQQANITA